MPKNVSESEKEAWIRAAEICCRVHAGIGFGYVSLHSGEGWPLTLVLTWYFLADGDSFSASYSMDALFLESLRADSMGFYADALIKRWKKEAQEMVSNHRRQNERPLFND